MELTQTLTAAAVAAALGFSGAALAMTKDEVKAEKSRIAAEYKADKAKCDGLKGNAKDVCMAQAKGADKIAKAELDARENDSANARYTVAIAKAEADYDVAKEKCDDKSGKAKDVCIKDAKAALTRAKGAANVDRQAAKGGSNAGQKVAEARRDAAEDQRDANYAAAKERCDSMSGNAKDRCVADAKARFNVH